MAKIDDYKPGNPEYDYWNDKNLYPTLNHEENFYTKQTKNSSPDGNKISFGSVFLITFVWIMLLAPFALFFSWKDIIVRIVFWSGLAIIIIAIIASFYNAFQEEKRKKQKK